MIVLIDYGSGNLHSAAKAFERAGKHTGQFLRVSNDPALLASASHIVLPGVGAFGDCAAGLNAIPGMRAALEEAVLEHGTPFFGVCVGMQMLAKYGYERGKHEGLGWIDGEVHAIPSQKDLRIPHMGWNTLIPSAQASGGVHPMLKGLPNDAHAYFVHSYHMQVNEPGVRIATTEYGRPITAAIAKGNIWGTQFHPEKSQSVGQAIIANFLKYARA